MHVLFEYFYIILLLNAMCMWPGRQIFHQSIQFKNSYVYLFILFSSFFNKPEILYSIIRYPSPQFCPQMVEIIAWNSLNDYSKSPRGIE